MPDTGSVIDQLLLVLQKNPGCDDFVKLVDAYRCFERYQEALNIAQQAVSRYPRILSAQIALARVCFESGDWNQAEPLFRNILHYAPDNIVANRIYAKMLLASGEKNRAVELLKRLSVLDPGDSMVTAQLNQYDDLLCASDRADGSDQPATETLALLYEQQGHLQQAVDTYRLFLRQHPDRQDCEQKLRTLEAKMSINGHGAFSAVARLEILLARVQERKRL